MGRSAQRIDQVVSCHKIVHELVCFACTEHLDIGSAMGCEGTGGVNPPHTDAYVSILRLHLSHVRMRVEDKIADKGMAQETRMCKSQCSE